MFIPVTSKSAITAVTVPKTEPAVVRAKDNR